MSKKEKLKRWKKNKPKTMDEAAARREAEKRGMRLVSYGIRYDAMEIADLPAEADEAIQEIHPLLRASPRRAIGRLRELLARFPQVAQFRNHLAVAFQKLGETAEAEALLKETHALFPDYLFGRVGYGESLLRQGRLAEVKALFPNGMEPQLMYPERKEFHVTEVRAVYTLAGLYHAKMGEIAQARNRIDVLRKLDGESPEVELLEGEIKMAILKLRTQKLFHLR
jgi:tetratricopeptide (TPR) repeat protein